MPRPMRHAAGRKARGLQGVSALRKKLRRIDPQITEELKIVVAESAQAIEFDALAGAPRQYGNLQHSIETKISSDGFTAIIGPGVKAAEIVRRKTGSAFAASSKKINLSKTNKHALFQFYKAYWYEFGTKGSEHVPAQPPRPFMQPAYKQNREWIRERVDKAVENILRQVANST